MSLMHYTKKRNYIIYYLPIQYREILIEWYQKVDTSTMTSTSSINFIWNTYVYSRLRCNSLHARRNILFV